MKSSAASALLVLVGSMAIGPIARADNLAELPVAPVMDEIVRAIIRLPGIGTILEPMIHPTAIRADAKSSAPTIRIAPMFTASSIGLRAVGTF